MRPPPPQGWPPLRMPSGHAAKRTTLLPPPAPVPPVVASHLLPHLDVAANVTAVPISPRVLPPPSPDARSAPVLAAALTVAAISVLVTLWLTVWILLGGNVAQIRQTRAASQLGRFSFGLASSSRAAVRSWGKDLTPVLAYREHDRCSACTWPCYSEKRSSQPWEMHAAIVSAGFRRLLRARPDFCAESAGMSMSTLQPSGVAAWRQCRSGRRCCGGVGCGRAEGGASTHPINARVWVPCNCHTCGCA